MKKFIFFLIFLLLAGGAVFFFGWAQFRVPPGSYGVMRSKTHGLEERVIKEGEFIWLWYKLIPTNVSISVYTLETVRYPVKSSGSLSSGDIYASIAGIKADFSWEIKGEISFSINPAHLPEFTVRENIGNNEELRKAEERLAERINNLALKRIISYIENGEEVKIGSLLIGASVPELESEIYMNFPDIENLSCVIQVLRYPDFALYRSLKALYQEYLTSQSAALKPDVRKEAESRIEGRIRFDELIKYGELLTKYPILIQFLAMEKGLPFAKIE